ncbi:MAG: hypothetical protein MRECE_11c051, partial [Mycoplasmataceae bacterium CE_OT135]
NKLNSYKTTYTIPMRVKKSPSALDFWKIAR